MLNSFFVVKLDIFVSDLVVGGVDLLGVGLFLKYLVIVNKIFCFVKFWWVKFLLVM